MEIRTTLCNRLSELRSSLRFKLLLRFTLFAAAITVTCVALFVLHELQVNKRHLRDKLRLQAKGLADSVRLPLYAESMDQLNWHAAEALRLPGMREVEIAAANGRVLVRLQGKGEAAPGELIWESAQVRSYPLTVLPGEFAAPGEEGELIGQVRLYRDTEELWPEVRRLALLTFLMAGAGWLLVSLSCYLLLRRVSASFDSLMRGLQSVHCGDYTSRIAVVCDDEPGRASASVNELAEKLRLREEENRRLHAELVGSMEFEIASKEQLVAVNLELEREIAERSRARQELKNLVEQLPVGIVWSDAEGSIEYLNGFILERTGYAAEELGDMERWFAGLCPDPVYRDKVVSRRRAAIEAWEEGNRIEFYEMNAVCRDGSLLHLNCSNQRAGGRTVDIVLDLTERELLQQQIVKNQKLESIGVLAGGIAHNFNNALTGVLGYISFAAKFLDNSHSAYPLLQQAEKATLRAAGFANQLLSFARGGAPIRKALSVRELVEESVQLATGASGVKVVLELCGKLPLVHVDDNQMRQAFDCICLNAVQAMPGGGTLTVRGRGVDSAGEKLPAPLCGRFVELSFQDQGCGIRDEDKSNIFTPYFTTKAELGTGLGLATVHSIIARHGGVIGFDTKLGQGTTFTLYLPVATPQQPLPEPERQGPAAVREEAGDAVLVMDDDETIRNLALEVLSAGGYRVTVCSNGDDAVSLYRQACRCGAPYLAVILDLTVPGGMGGKEAAQQILSGDPGANLIVSSGYSNDVVMQQYREYGFRAASPKPYDAHQLYRLLDELKEGR